MKTEPEVLPEAQAMAQPPSAAASLGWKAALGWSLVAVISFQLAHAAPRLWFLYGVFLFACLQLARLPGDRVTMRVSWLLGIAVYGPQLGFFWTIFGPAAVGLWLVLATWPGIFLLLVRNCRRRFGPAVAAVLTPFLWTGLEYFRSELYFLRFSWLSAGYLWSDLPQVPWLSQFGVYGIGFCLAAVAAMVVFLRKRAAWIAALAGFALLGSSSFLPVTGRTNKPTHGELKIAGVQLEFPSEKELADSLEGLRRAQPDTKLFVASEYSFDGPVPERFRDWCRTNQIYLVAGGKEVVSDDVFYNTAFVVGPAGDIVFQQAKSVPIQFFKDGLPAPRRTLWESPWGRIGICICYDLSYTRVVDDLVQQGAQALLVPTMDVAYWGEDQHRLHARVAPVRAAEYGVPIFRLASSGVSQLVDDRGLVVASAPFPGDSATLAGVLRLPTRGALPWDRWLAPFSTTITIATIILLIAGRLSSVLQRRHSDRPGGCQMIRHFFSIFCGLPRTPPRR